MLQIYSMEHDYTLKKIISQAYNIIFYHEGESLPLDIFVLKPNFTDVLFSEQPKPLRIGPYEILDRLSDILSQDGTTFHIILHFQYL